MHKRLNPIAPLRMRLVVDFEILDRELKMRYQTLGDLLFPSGRG
jgi:hypothetical protein